MRALSNLAVTAATALLLMGCGTLNSYNDGCAGAFSGVRTDVAYLDSYQEFRDGWDLTTVAMDVPLSALLDTLALPATAFFDPRSEDTPGCEWTDVMQRPNSSAGR